MIRYRPTPRANYMRSIFAANSLWPIAASIAQGQSSAKLCLAHELHELLFGHLGLLVGHIALVSKDRICNTLQVDIGNLAARTVINLKERLLDLRPEIHRRSVCTVDPRCLGQTGHRRSTPAMTEICLDARALPAPEHTGPDRHKPWERHTRIRPSSNNDWRKVTCPLHQLVHWRQATLHHSKKGAKPSAGFAPSLAGFTHP